jgi:methylaspartate ammonia-lyase
MDAKNYCRSIEVELYGWKAKMYDMVRKVEKLRNSDKQKVAAQVEQLHKHIEDMERLIEQLQTECPVDFGAEKKQIDETTAGMKKKYEEAMSAVLQF